MPLFDTHAHYNDDAFDQNRKGLLDALPDAGVGAVVIPGVDVESSRSALALAESRPWLFAAAGIHPEDCAGCTAADFSAIRDLCREKKVVAIGEIGLDYYWAENPPKEFQQMVFRRQLELALELELPVIVHDREAHGDSLEIVKEFPGVRGVFHCFSGSPEMAEELLKRGWYLGFDGPVTYKNARRAPEVVAVTPLDRIVVETDAPYMSPVPNRGRRNDSRNLPYIVEKLAEWKGISPGGDGGAHLEQWPAAVWAGGEGMKKAFLMVLACLLLAGCGAPSETVTPTDSWPDSALAETNEAAAESPPEPISTAPAESPPATAPAEPLSAPAVVTAGQAPEEPYDLPTEVIGLKDWIGESRWNHDPVGLLAELPERELSLYGVTKWLDSSALLRWGDSLAEFSWSFGGPLIVEPQLWCWDVDSDGQEEVVVINHVDSGTGTSIEELHVVKKDGDGTLTDYCFPESLWQEDLSGLLSVVSDGDRTYTVLGADLVDLTDEIQTQFPDLNPAMIEDTSTGRWANFSVQSGTDGTKLIFSLRVLRCWRGGKSPMTGMRRRSPLPSPMKTASSRCRTFI